MIWTQFAVACVMLSALFTAGWFKTDLDLMARYVDAESAPGDLIILFPGSFGAALNRYLRKPHPQIDYPVIGAVGRYQFDHHVARIRDAGPLGVALDSIAAAAATGRRVWLISPSKWLGDSSSMGELPEPRTSEAAAFRERAGILRSQLLRRYGAPAVPLSFQQASWSMEVLTLEVFAHPGSGG